MSLKPTLGTSDKTPRNGGTARPADCLRAPLVRTGVRGSMGIGSCAEKLCVFVLIEWPSFPSLPEPDSAASNRRVWRDLAFDGRGSRRQMPVAPRLKAHRAAGRK